MPRRKVIGLVLAVGISIGIFVPYAAALFGDHVRQKNTVSAADRAAIVSLNQEVRQIAAQTTYHFKLDQGMLSVLEGKPGTDGKVILSGISTAHWPKEFIDLAPKAEFHSLDEVQSFIDTVDEPLWQN